ncbi:MAG: metallophosphoesterase [Planctomycetes bacterium]|nr:metallophosphoesterase [Planctomycetota bacterium]
MRTALLACAAAILAAADPVYITAFRDPLHAMEAHRLVAAGAELQPVTISVAGAPDRQVAPIAVPLPGTTWVVQRALIDGLPAGAEVGLRFGDQPATRVRTVPDPAKLDRPLRVVNGGDTMHKPEWLAKTAKVMCAKDPDLIVLGGDLAYEDGRNGERVAVWIRTWAESAVAPDGRAIPFVSCIGNHEVQGHYNGTPEKAPFYFAMLPIGATPLHSVDVGDEISFILLDSGHVTKVAGKQTEWLHGELAARSKRPAVIPVYHYPAWPVVKVPKGGKDPSDNEISKQIRANWVPLFEAAGVRVALEHDQHTYKRTVPLKAGQPDPTGIIYLGDGAWGVDVRKVFPGLTWLAKGAEVRHGYLLEIARGGGIAVTAIDEDGTVFDQVSIAPR